MEQYDEDDVNGLKVDQDNFNRAIDHLIDSVSHFKATGSTDLTEIEAEEWGKMLEVLDFARFIVSGLMYSYGISICGHDHDTDEHDNDE